MYLPTEEQKAVVAALRRFLDQKLEPEIRAFGEGHIPAEQMKEWHTQLVEFGVTAGPLPEGHGGLGTDWITHLMLFEEVVYSSLDVAVPSLINVVSAKALCDLASDDIVARYVPGVASGDVMLAFAISEPDVGSDVAGLKTTARDEGDHWVINGEKTWISNGTYADAVLTTCRTGEGTSLTHILVDREEHGFEARNIEKVAMNGQSTAQLYFNDVRVPKSNTIGAIGRGLRQTLELFEYARCHMAVWGLGVARRARDEAIRYSIDRTQHGKPIAAHQLIADKIATMATEIDAARLLAYRAMAMVESGQRADVECSMAKWYGTEIAVGATRQAMQIHGGNGVTTEFIVERLAREALIAPIPDGTTEIQKLIISRGLTGIDPI